MPSHDLIRHYADIFTVAQAWRWNGQHYQRTALDWLDRFDNIEHGRSSAQLGCS